MIFGRRSSQRLDGLFFRNQRERKGTLLRTSENESKATQHHGCWMHLNIKSGPFPDRKYLSYQMKSSILSLFLLASIQASKQLTFVCTKQGKSLHHASTHENQSYNSPSRLYMTGRRQKNQLVLTFVAMSGINGLLPSPVSQSPVMSIFGLQQPCPSID